MKLIEQSLGAGIVLCLAGLASGAGDAAANGHPDRLPTAALGFMQKYPGVRAEAIGGRVSVVYGRPMTAGATALLAADAFVEQDAAVFGAGRPTLALSRVNELMSSASTIVVYDQTLDGLPVERGVMRVLVKGTPEGQVVALANARLAPAPEGGFRPDAFDADQAKNVVAAKAEWGGIQEFGQPTLVVYAGERDEEQPVETIRAWKFWGRGPGIGAVPLQKTFFVDASTGNIAAVREEILFGSADVNGTVKGWGSPGMLPDDTYNPPALLNIPEIRASITGGNNAFANTSGVFTINNALGGPLSVMATTTQLRWVSVANNASGGNISATVSGVFPPGPADIVLNSPPPPAGNSFSTAQVNASIHQTNAHNYFRDRAPSFTAIDNVVPANVNISDTCNAFFDPVALNTNFFLQGESTTTPGVFCVNTAYSGVVAHEYGHYIVNRLGLAQGAFGEGFSDTIALLAYDDGILGRGFRLGNVNSFVRNPEGANIQYPCSASCGGASHCCGQIIGGLVWDMRNNFVNAYGQPTGIELIRQLHVDWALVTAGGIGANSAHPQTAIEWLTVDDNDANINNGTPNYALICDAFAQHSIACPQLVAIDITYPSGRPAMVSPFGTTTLEVNAVPVSATPAPNSGVFFYNINGGSYTSIPMTEVSTNSYQVNFPSAACGSSIGYYVQVGIQGGGVAQSPGDAPIGNFAAIAATGLSTAYSATETSAGWSLVAAGDNAATGRWAFGDPNGTAAQPEDDHTANPGVNCFFTGQGAVGGGLGDADVDTGITTLTTPAINLSAVGGATISYWRWYSNDTGADPNNDAFTIDVTSNGTTWVNVETVGPSGVDASAGWRFHSFIVNDLVPLTANVRVRFIAADLGAGSLVEAAIDDFQVDVAECAPPPGCLGDANQDGVVNFLDITTVLANFGGTGPMGDADSDGDVDFSDITTVLAHFLDSCP